MNSTDVQIVKARKGDTTKRKSGGAARHAKEPAGGRGSRPYLVLAPDVNSAIKLINAMGWNRGQVSVFTEAKSLRDFVIFPNEDIYMVIGADKEFLEQLQIATTLFIPGEHYNLRVYSL